MHRYADSKECLGKRDYNRCVIESRLPIHEKAFIIYPVKGYDISIFLPMFQMVDIFAPPAERYLKKLKDKRLKEKFKEAVKLISENPYIDLT